MPVLYVYRCHVHIINVLFSSIIDSGQLVLTPLSLNIARYIFLLVAVDKIYTTFRFSMCELNFIQRTRRHICKIP